MKPRLAYLDALRLVAALMVVFYHYIGRNHSHWGADVEVLFPFVSKFTSWGALGVQLFFLISGFVILMSAEGRTLGAFVASRVSRLYPAYWFAVLSTAAMMTWIARPGEFRDVSIQEVLINLTMMQSGFGVRSIDGVYWTLWVELLFYIMIGCLVLIGITERRVLAIALLWPLIGAIAQNSDATFLTAILSPQYAPFFSAGMVLYLIYSRGHNVLRWLVFTYASLVAVFQASTYWVAGAMSRDTERNLSPAFGAVVVVLMIGVVILVTLTPLSHRGPRWLVTAGALTYPLYLIHENWGWWMIGWLDPLFGKWATVAVVVLTMLVAAFVIERLIERPLRKVLSSGIKSSFEQMLTGRASTGLGRQPEVSVGPSGASS
ncbi:acyltransferase [Microbacterium sp. KUDC0406]|uniref:acyltransferase family protein n=1 Tax=Microbacterium sp. KUDC0406 TaxID=2909588 RepID=UPI001F2E79BB|nr:acyltransferase [Microbacterium sp. KUDC0406]UJP09722.1 acyltransferase [Microbacterium sp. KUDC0406]